MSNVNTGFGDVFTGIGLRVTAFGDVFAGIGVREPQPNASEAFTKFGVAHREVDRFAIQMLKTVKPVSAGGHWLVVSSQ